MHPPTPVSALQLRRLSSRSLVSGASSERRSSVRRDCTAGAAGAAGAACPCRSPALFPRASPPGPRFTTKEALRRHSVHSMHSVVRRLQLWDIVLPELFWCPSSPHCRHSMRPMRRPLPFPLQPPCTCSRRRLGPSNSTEVIHCDRSCMNTGRRAGSAQRMGGVLWALRQGRPPSLSMQRSAIRGVRFTEGPFPACTGERKKAAKLHWLELRPANTARPASRGAAGSPASAGGGSARRRRGPPAPLAAGAASAAPPRPPTAGRPGVSLAGRRPAACPGPLKGQ